LAFWFPKIIKKFEQIVTPNAMDVQIKKIVPTQKPACITFSKYNSKFMFD